MYQRIKEAAEAALKLQNKDAMDATLREIVAMCATVRPTNAEPTSDPVAEAASQSTASPVTGAGAYCDTGDDKPRAPRGVKKSKGAK